MSVARDNTLWKWIVL